MANREKINTVAMAIAKLQAAGDIALATGCELAKIPAVDALEIADFLKRLTAEAMASARNVGKARTIYRCPHCDTLLAYRGLDRCPMCGGEVNWDA